LISFFDHTGDIGVRVQAATLEGLFDTAADAFAEIITDPTTIQPLRGEAIVLPATEKETLLVDFLNELLFRFDARGWLAQSSAVRIYPEREGRYRLEATTRGEPFDPARHAIKVLVKAVTYHGLSIARTPDGYEAMIVFDI
jgi:SHS2 domain-containing protein